MRVTLVALYDVYSFGIRILASVLEKAGYDVTCVFFKTSTYADEKWTESELEDLIYTVSNTTPDLIGIAVRSPLFNLFRQLCIGIKHLVDAPIVAGGHHATICPEECSTYADSVCVGEGENAILEICRDFSISFIKKPLIQDLDTIPLPRYSSNDVYLYTNPKFDSITPPVGLAIMTARGCFFDCSFCYNRIQKEICKGLGKYVRRRSVNHVISEVELIKTLFPNLTEIVFTDNVFTWDNKWIDEFCEKFPEYGLKFRCFSHFRMLDKRMLEKLVDAGCNIITLGFQTGSERSRKEILNRPETNKEIIKGSKLLADLGINIRYDLIFDIPYETEEDHRETEKLIKKLARPFTIRRFRLRYYPKTVLTERALSDGYITKKDLYYQPFGDNWLEFVEYK